MQCVNAHWVPTAHLPLSNSQPRQSITSTRSQFPKTSSPNHSDGNARESESSAPAAAVHLPSHVKSITSTSNPFVKHCVKLRLSSSYRHQHRSVLVVGSTPIREIYKFYESMQERPGTIDCLLLLDKGEIPEGLDGLPVRTVRVNSMVMKKLSGLQSTESTDTISLMKVPSTFHNLDDNWQEADCRRWFPSAHRILVLDGIQVVALLNNSFLYFRYGAKQRNDCVFSSNCLDEKESEESDLKSGILGEIFAFPSLACHFSLTEQDPGNLGTLLRSALAFRWGGVFLLPGCCDPFNEKALRASRGAYFQLPVVTDNWAYLQTLTKTFHMKILAGHPQSRDQLKPVSLRSQALAYSFAETPLCLVLGTEGNGLFEKTRRVSELISIPMIGEFESLNVSVAGGIFLFMLQPVDH
ncbi:hypothetical protein RHGRI_030121 [Rhododendron griersonianum]|uniref:tRNA/rRNA methyltransferase SpoU type domain-containing protein n=1 Tax=Rhododendron griersonianum TaxID=479676 RepID=A0AAV6IQF1_9ERIC|nr:hypothetical protein RHGRI_030121 [Rhododendron griersonianum]